MCLLILGWIELQNTFYTLARKQIIPPPSINQMRQFVVCFDILIYFYKCLIFYEGEL